MCSNNTEQFQSKGSSSSEVDQTRGGTGFGDTNPPDTEPGLIRTPEPQVAASSTQLAAKARIEPSISASPS
jgi:hypothetical protein